MFVKKIERWYEAIGLSLLLFAFGWQCLEDHSSQMKVIGYIGETYETTFAIWEGVYDEALHSDRYKGKRMVSVDYDSLYDYVKDWNKIKKELETIESQENFSFWIRTVFYVIGSVLVILSKMPNNQRCPYNQLT